MVLISTGLLSERLTLLVNQPVSNGAGGWTDDYVEVGKVFGAIATTQQRSGFSDETLAGAQRTVPELASITLSALELDSDAKYRVRGVDGRTWEIVAMQVQQDVVLATGRRV